MTRQEMLQALSEGLDPVAVSLKKWQEEKDLAERANCACCEAFRCGWYNTDPEKDKPLCPLPEENICGKRNSLYDKWDGSLSDRERARRQQKMVAALTALAERRKAERETVEAEREAAIGDKTMTMEKYCERRLK